MRAGTQGKADTRQMSLFGGAMCVGGTRGKYGVHCEGVSLRIHPSSSLNTSPFAGPGASAATSQRDTNLEYQRLRFRGSRGDVK